MSEVKFFLFERVVLQSYVNTTKFVCSVYVIHDYSLDLFRLGMSDRTIVYSPKHKEPTVATKWTLRADSKFICTDLVYSIFFVCNSVVMSNW